MHKKSTLKLTRMDNKMPYFIPVFHIQDNNHEVAIPALESIIKHSPDNKRVITAIR